MKEKEKEKMLIFINAFGIEELLTQRALHCFFGKAEKSLCRAIVLKHTHGTIKAERVFEENHSEAERKNALAFF